jgi:hypothetical protein
MSFEWANEASRQVVERGGLQEGETLESRYWDMAVKLGSYIGVLSLYGRRLLQHCYTCTS